MKISASTVGMVPPPKKGVSSWALVQAMAITRMRKTDDPNASDPNAKAQAKTGALEANWCRMEVGKEWMNVGTKWMIQMKL